MTHANQETQNLAATGSVMAFAHALNSAKVGRLADIAFPDREQGGYGAEKPRDPMPLALARLRLLALYPYTVPDASPEALHDRLNAEHDSLALHVTMPRPAPSAAVIAQAFDAMDQHSDEVGEGLRRISDSLEYLHAPSRLMTAGDHRQAEAGLTKGQRQYRRRKRRRDLAMNIFEFFDRFSNNRQAERFLAALSWPDGVACPHCGSRDVSFCHNDPGETFNPVVWSCNACDQDFTIVTNTIMAEPNLPPVEWIYLAYRMLHDRNGLLLNPAALADTAGGCYGLQVEPHEAQDMYRKIQQILPHAKPRTFQPCHHRESLKMLARGIRTAPSTATSADDVRRKLAPLDVTADDVDDAIAHIRKE